VAALTMFSSKLQRGCFSQAIPNHARSSRRAAESGRLLSVRPNDFLHMRVGNESMTCTLKQLEIKT